MNPDFTGDAVLSEMVAEVGAASPLYRPSNFWNNLNQANLEMLETHGLDNFKRTVAQNYYNWMVIGLRDNQLRSLVRDWFLHPSMRPFLNSIEVPDILRTTVGLERRIGWREMAVYKIFVGLLWEFTRRHDRTGLSQQLQEPSIGNPIVIRRKSRLISQDLANSIREFGAIREAHPALGRSRTTIAELGAGYGRLAFVALSAPESRYIVFDIPPALRVSQWYLTQIFGKEKIFPFRRFRRYADIRDELEASRIGFFTPNQIEMFPDRVFDVFVTVSTLSEMRADQTRNYLQQMQRTVRDVVYLKQWASWQNVEDGRSFSRADISFSELTCVMDRNDAVQDRFLEQVWKRI
ncbi:MAG TPA: putative sugar O-methyltransferase [Burkholderiales bacterium]|nr:putative sugar O-methyltransferase [Burkholderiales bacterium]